MAPVENPEVGVVKFTIKEMFERIETRLTSIDAKLNHKVDDADFFTLQDQVVQLNRGDLTREAAEQAVSNQSQKLLSRARYRWPLVISGASALAYFLAIITPHVKF
jgi:hypothetical protein